MDNQLIKSQQNELETRKAQLNQLGKYVKTKDEQSVIVARAYPLLSDMDWASANNKAEMVSLLTEWNFISGCGQLNTKEELTIIGKFIVTNFSGMTLQEIEQAMHWAVSGKLTEDESPVENYGRFTPQYISKVLQLYGGLKNRVLSNLHYRQLQERWAQDQQEKNKPREYEVVVQEHAEFLIKHMEAMLKSENTRDTVGSLVWRFLKRTDLFKPETYMTAEIEEKAETMATIWMRKNSKKVQQGIDGTLTVLTGDNDKAYMVNSFKQSLLIRAFLQTLSSIPNFVNTQPNETIYPKAAK